MKSFQVSEKVKMKFGAGVVKQLGPYMAGYGIKKAIVVYDQGVKAVGNADKVLDSIRSAGIECIEFDHVASDAAASVVDEAAEIARANQVDAIVAVGGGSVCDTAKAVNALMANPGSIRRLFIPENKNHQIQSTVKLFTVETMAGTSSGVSRGGMVYDDINRKKYSIGDPERNTAAFTAFVDPELTLTVPAWLTAWTGGDILAHILESYTGINSNPWAEIRAEGIVPYIYESLKAAVKDGSDIEARSWLHFGSMIGGQIMNDSGPHLAHSVAHGIGAVAHMHHGLLCALALPFALRLGFEAYPEKARKVAKMISLDVPDSATDAEVSKMVFDAFLALNKELGIGVLRDYDKFNIDDVEEYAELALGDGCTYLMPNKPEGGWTKDYFVDIIKEMYALT